MPSHMHHSCDTWLGTPPGRPPRQPPDKRLELTAAAGNLDACELRGRCSSIVIRSAAQRGESVFRSSIPVEKSNSIAQSRDGDSDE